MNLSLRSRIYLSLILLLAGSFLVIGLVSFYQFKEQNEEYHKNRLQRKEQAILSSLNYYFQKEREDDFFPFYTSEFQSKIQEFSDINNLMINIYDVNGILITSSDLERIKNREIPNKLTNELLAEIKEKKRVLVDEIVGDSDQLSSYSYLENLNGDNISIIHLPYFFDLAENKSEIAQFLVTLAEIYVAILMLGLIVAYWLSNYIVKSLKQIGEKIKSIQINERNEPLQWNHKDEIGALVGEYNRMVNELEISAEKLARTERESAWREMAKQVAHEIKNPLTPMKLSVQQLERAWNDKSEDWEERFKRFTRTMKEQIDTLSQIAGEFSDFAKMPKARVEVVDLEKVIEGCCALFQDNDVRIKVEKPIQINTNVKADESQMRRTFNNLITNSIQAISNNKMGEITIRMAEKENKLCIELEDNGNGIPEEIRNKIFIPNFTTKSTGTGLGLALIKNIIEFHRGTIDFKTESGIGTTFYITLPLQKP